MDIWISYLLSKASCLDLHYDLFCLLELDHNHVISDPPWPSVELQHNTATVTMPDNSIVTMVTHCCSYCYKDFTSAAHLKRHVTAVHLKLKPHHCPICSQAFAHNFMIKPHLRKHHHQWDDLVQKLQESSSNLSELSSQKRHCKETYCKWLYNIFKMLF